MEEHILRGLVVLAALGSFAQLLAWHLRIPSILLLLGFGMLAGPVLGILDPQEMLGSATFPLISLGAAIVLFEGGLTVRWQDLRDVRGPVSRLITIGLCVTWITTACITHYLVGLSWSLSTLLGAILVVTGPTVVGPILRQARPSGDVGRIIHFEGIINDPLGAIFALLVFQVIQVEQVETAVSLILWSVLRAALVSAALAVATGYGYIFLRKRGWIPDSLENAILIGLVLSVFLVAQSVQSESGLLAVTILGIFLASQTQVDLERNVDFAEHLRNMLIASLFLLLTARVQWADLKRLPLEGLAFSSLIIFVVRPLAVFLSTIGTKLKIKEKIFLSAMAPRGVVAAAVASVFALRLTSAGYEDAEMLMPLTFLVIASCVATYGLLARPLVLLLGLRQESPKGLLFLGANPIARSLAEALKAEDVQVTLVDRERHRVMTARSLGLTTEYGRIDAEHIFSRLNLQDVRHFVALTSNHDANGLAITHLRKVLDASKVWQVACDLDTPTQNVKVAHVGGIFGEGYTYDELLSKLRTGVIRVTRLSDKFSMQGLVDHHGDDTIPLISIQEDGTPRILGPHEQKPQPGERVVCLIQRSAQQPDSSQS